MKLFTAILIAMFLTSCYQVPTTYVKRCQWVDLDGVKKSRKYKRTYREVKREVRICRVCNFKGKCWNEDRSYGKR